MSRKTMQLRLDEALKERTFREKRPWGFGGTLSDQMLSEYIRTVEASMAALPEDLPIIEKVTDAMIAECMVCVEYPLRWGVAMAPEEIKAQMREFSHALAERLAATQTMGAQS